MPKAGFRFKPKRRKTQEHGPDEKPEGIDLSEEDIDVQIKGEKFSALFLGSFEIDLIRQALSRFGITQQLKKIGYPELDIQFRPRGPFEHHLTFRDATDSEKPLIGEVVLKEGRYHFNTHPIEHGNISGLMLLTIEWILMQHIKGEFTDGRPRLPGQNFPGLGIGNQVNDLLTWVARLMHKDGLVNVPEYFHNAVFYDKWFKFVDPKVQGAMEAIHRHLQERGHNICEISFAAYFDCLIDETTGEPYNWVPHEMVLPLKKEFKAYFKQAQYRQIVEQTRDNLAIAIDESKFAEKMKTADNIEW